MKEIRKTARDLMAGFCRVCPVCNGRACAGEVPGMGGPWDRIVFFGQHGGARPAHLQYEPGA